MKEGLGQSSSQSANRRQHHRAEDASGKGVSHLAGGVKSPPVRPEKKKNLGSKGSSFPSRKGRRRGRKRKSRHQRKEAGSGLTRGGVEGGMSLRKRKFGKNDCYPSVSQLSGA